jgi:Uma2 family endonuclease
MVTATKRPYTNDTIVDLANSGPLTAEDLQTLPDDGNRYEIIGGQLVVSPSPSMRHQKISFELAGALYAHLKQSGLGHGFSAPADVHLSPSDVVQPDLLVVLDDRADIIQERGIMGAPDLVIEILSPSSVATDFLRKSRLYERCGVPEYWIVDPVAESIVIQTLEDGRYVAGQEFGRDDTLHSTVLDGFELELVTIFPKPADGPDSAKEPQSTDDR